MTPVKIPLPGQSCICGCWLYIVYHEGTRPTAECALLMQQGMSTGDHTRRYLVPDEEAMLREYLLEAGDNLYWQS